MNDSKVAFLFKDLATLDWSTALDQDEMYRTLVRNMTVVGTEPFGILLR